MRATKAIINLRAVENNLKVIRQLAPRSKIMAVVKADAYGHGINQVALSLTQADAIAVSCVDEAIQLREAGVNQPIVLLEGFFSADELPLIVALKLQIVVHQQKQLDDLLDFAKNHNSKANIQAKIHVWLKLNSGMNRLGFSAQTFQRAYDVLKNAAVVAKVCLMSHFACADDISHPLTQQQINQFMVTSKHMPEEKSLANSAAILAWPESHLDWVRPGILLYGCSPVAGYQGGSHHLIPVMNLESELFVIKLVNPGDSVGYCASWTAERETRIGVISIGYGDGYPRHAKPGTPVWINGNTYPLVGKVSMDMITVDLGMDDEFSLGDRVVLWGKELPVEQIASCAQTIAYTLLCGVTSRVSYQWNHE